MRLVVSFLLLFTLVGSCVSAFYLPGPSQLLPLTQEFQPTLVEGITVYPKDPLRFDFIINPAQAQNTNSPNADIQKIINYFFASLTIPKNNLWVNLSPYERHRVIPQALAGTEMGRDLLAQDYLLKQLTASLMDPKTTLGKKFWHEVYQRTYARFGTTAIAVNTFNKVWIVPDRAVIYQKWPSAFIVDSHLKVLLEEDYLALSHHGAYKSPDAARLISGIVKEMILPKIEQEVNTGRYFAPLRQIYHAMILAKWYEQTFTSGPLAKDYVNQNKIKGIDLKDKNLKETIYRRYLRAYRQGLYNFVMEDYDSRTKETVPRKYFAGGITMNSIPLETEIDHAMAGQPLDEILSSHDRTVTVMASPLLDQERDHAPVILKINGSDMIGLNTPQNTFGHVENYPVSNGQVIYFSIPDGDKVESMQISGDTSSILENIYPVNPLGPSVLNNPELIRHENTPLLHGAGFSMAIQPLAHNPSIPFNISRFFYGSGKSVRDFDRSFGEADPMARQDINTFVNGGKDIEVKKWKESHGTGGQGTVLEAVNQPRPGALTAQDEHNYVLRLIFPPDVTVTVGADNNLTVTAHHPGEILLKVELYSDHAPIQHLTLEELYTPETLDRLAELQGHEKERFLRMLYLGEYLIGRHLPMLAGSPYYATVFPPDVFIVERELIGFLKPEILRDQFYELLKLEHNGQFPHEVDIRQSSRIPAYFNDRYRLIRADTELLALLYAQTLLRHQEIGIDWDQKIRGNETVRDILGHVAEYVLAKAQKLENPEDYRDLLTPKKAGDPRGTWRDGASSTFYGQYIYTLQFLMVLALEATEEIDAQKHILGHAVAFKSLIDTWQSAEGQFEFTQTREERIRGLMNWFSWKINQNEGFEFIMALFEDAKKYYNIDYTFNNHSPREALDSIHSFLETYMPQQPYTGQAIALDASGNLIKIDDTDPFMFAVSSLKNVSMDEIKKDLKSEFLHVVFGGTATTSGELLTSLPALTEKDRYIANPVGAAGPADIYETHEHNYHTVKWIAMEYKKLNGLVKQINDLLDSGHGLSADVQHLILAVKLRFDELSRLSGQETEETLEPYAVFSGGRASLNWRPYGSAEALTGNETPLGIRSGALQGFNLIIMAAVSNWEKLTKRIESQGGRGFMAYLKSLNSAEGHKFVSNWLGQPLNSMGPGNSTGLDSSMHARDSKLGGIDLNTDLYHIDIITKDQRPSNDSINPLPIQIYGLVPVIINNKPFHPTPFLQDNDR